MSPRQSAFEEKARVGGVCRRFLLIAIAVFVSISGSLQAI